MRETIAGILVFIVVISAYGLFRALHLMRDE